MSEIAAPDPWAGLRAHTAARIALGRCGVSLPTAEVLKFGLAHAQARDAVHLPFDAAALAAELARHGFETIEVESAAPDRATYLHRPDLGRRLSTRSAARLGGAGADAGGDAGGDARGDAGGAACDVLCVVGDGLSAAAVHRHAAALLLALRVEIESAGRHIGPVVLAQQARVALGDAIGAALHARVVVMLVGERPGLSSPDSLGAYLTWAPRPGRTDAERNCVSNIRPEGLGVDAAATRVAWLLAAAERLGATGVRLKDESAAARLAPRATPATRGAAPG